MVMGHKYELHFEISKPGADVVKVCWNKALWLAVQSNMTIFNQ